MGSNPVLAWIFFQTFFFHHCLTIVHYGEDRFQISFLKRSSHLWFSHVYFQVVFWALADKKAFFALNSMFKCVGLVDVQGKTDILHWNLYFSLAQHDTCRNAWRYCYDLWMFRLFSLSMRSQPQNRRANQNNQSKINLKQSKLLVLVHWWCLSPFFRNL